MAAGLGGVLVVEVPGEGVAGMADGVSATGAACGEGDAADDAVAEDAVAADREPGESWHPVSTRIPPMTAMTDAPLRPRIAHPLLDRRALGAG
ncbi:hypothetical protein [Streptomyces sp. NPDC047706]|uniref:hypothetical protein n=1 Tax=Streptomyces sp. NPDC047706 TaxID=3365486 RepID=UPI00372281A2